MRVRLDELARAGGAFNRWGPQPRQRLGYDPSVRAVREKFGPPAMRGRLDELFAPEALLTDGVLSRGSGWGMIQAYARSVKNLDL